MNVIFDHSEPVAANIHTFWFKPEKPVRYIAGQFTELYLPHDAPDERGAKRWFTLSSSPTEPLLGITTKFAAEHGSTFKRELGVLHPGTPLKLADPMGDFVLPKDPTIPLVFVAAGLGITPVRSMIRYLHDKQEQRAIQLMYAVTHPDDLAFARLFQNYELHFTPIIKQAPRSYSGETGSLDAKRIRQLAHITDRTLIYLSGPELMVEKLTKHLLAAGLPPERVITDYFPGYSGL